MRIGEALRVRRSDQPLPELQAKRKDLVLPPETHGSLDVLNKKDSAGRTHCKIVAHRTGLRRAKSLPERMLALWDNGPRLTHSSVCNSPCSNSVAAAAAALASNSVAANAGITVAGSAGSVIDGERGAPAAFARAFALALASAAGSAAASGSASGSAPGPACGSAGSAAGSAVAGAASGSAFGSRNRTFWRPERKPQILGRSGNWITGFSKSACNFGKHDLRAENLWAEN